MLRNTDLKGLAAYLWVACVPFLLLYISVFDNYAMKWDMADYFFPMRYLIGEAIQNGLLPIWNPYQYFGQPMYGDPQSGFWYPISWIIGYFNGYTLSTMYFEYALHAAIGGMGFLFLSRRFSVSWTAAIIFAMMYSLNGFYISNAQHLSWIIQAAWLPWVLGTYYASVYQKSKPTIIATAGSLFMMLTGGYPAFFLVLHYFLVPVFLVSLVYYLLLRNYGQIRSLLISNIGIYSLFTMFSAGYLYSFYVTFPLISRAGALTLERVMESPFSPQSLISLVWPYAVAASDGFNSDVSMINGYIGLLGLASLLPAAITKKPAYLSAIFAFGILCLLASFGNYTPVREWLYYSLPGMNLFRFPAMFRLFFIMGSLIAGAWWLNRIIKRQEYQALTIILSILLSTYAVTIIWFSLSGESWIAPKLYLTVPESSVLQRMAIQSIPMIAIAGLMLFIWSKRKATFWLIPLVLIELFFTLQLSEPATIISNVRTKHLNKTLSSLPKGFPPPENVAPITNCGVNYDLEPIWYNQSILTKRPCHAGFNPFQLVSSIELAANEKSRVVPTIRYRNNAGELVGDSAYFSGYNTEGFQIKYPYPVSELVVMQANFPGWQARINNRWIEPVPNLSVLVFNLAEPVTEIELIHDPFWLKPLMWLSFLSLVGSLMALAFFSRISG